MERLDKLLADRACISRKDAKALIRRGAVLVNDVIPKSMDQKCAETDEIILEGRRLNLSPFIYIMLNKPQGVVCATRDNGCDTVLDLLPPELLRKGLFPAGRLDKDTEGFVLITDDGMLAHKMLAPKSHVPKTYEVRLDAPADAVTLAGIFAHGMDLGDGDMTSPAELRQTGGDGMCFELVIYEGVYHQVKRMFARCGGNVATLRRSKIGGLALDGSLASGEARLLSAAELACIFA